MRPGHQILICHRQSPAVSRLLLNKDYSGHDSLDKIHHIGSCFHMDITLQVTDHMADSFLRLTDQELSGVNQLGSLGAWGRDQTRVPEHGHDLFLFSLLAQLLSLFEVVLLLYCECPSPVIAVLVFLMLFLQRRTEQDQVQIVVFGQMK